MTLETPTSINSPTKARIRLAWIIAVAADAIQIGAAPFVAEGFMSPLNDALDIAVAIALIFLIGWHLAFIPSFFVKMLPVADLAPTWTLAVFIATRGKIPKADMPAALPNERVG
jgi:hypothetical protein